MSSGTIPGRINMTFTRALPLLLSFLIGLLVGVLTAGFLPTYSRTIDRMLVKSRSDSLIWLLILAAFAFGVLVTVALSGLP
jgi:hypothetical protein